MSFADLEQRVTTTVLARLSNAVCSIDGGMPVPVIFEDAYAQANVGAYGMAASAPQITLATANVPANPIGPTYVIGATTYLVAKHQPAGAGLSLLELEVAA